MKNKMVEIAEAIGARYALVVRGKNPYTKFYKRGTWEQSRNCLLFWNFERQRWENSSELSFTNIEKGMDWTDTPYSLIDFVTQTRSGTYDPSTPIASD